MCFFFFFSSRRRHTRCALVTGVQTCALPICAASCAEFSRFGRTRRPMTIPIDPLKLITAAAAPLIKAVGREYKLRGADEKLIADRKRVVSGKSVSVRVDLGGRRISKKNTEFMRHKYKDNTRHITKKNT